MDRPTEEKVTIKIKLDSNDPLDQRVNILHFHEEETRFIKPEPDNFVHEPIRIKDEILLLSESEAKVTNEKLSNIVCVKCRCAFDLRGRLPLSREVYEGVVTFVCVKCYQLDGPSGSGSEERRELNATNDKQFICGECDRAFRERGILRRHIDCFHKKLKNFVCGECDHAFAEKGRLHRHIVSVHKKSKEFVCGDCNRAFKEQRNLNRHVDSVHKKIKKFVCDQCGHAFTEQRNLKRHVCSAVHKI